jgi:diacylglycerol kinase family enzyme
MDVIRTDSSYALLEFNSGLVGHTIIYAAELFPRLPKRFLRKYVGLAYTLCAVRTLFNKQLMNQHYTILLDGEDFSGNYANIQVSNVAVNGGTLVPSPYAHPKSGYLNAIFVKTGRKRDVIKSMGDYNKGRFEKYDFYVHRTFKKMEIKSDYLMSVQMDGEGFYAKEANLEILPGRIKVFAPPGIDFADYSHMAHKNKKKGGAKA